MCGVQLTCTLSLLTDGTHMVLCERRWMNRACWPFGVRQPWDPGGHQGRKSAAKLLGIGSSAACGYGPCRCDRSQMPRHLISDAHEWINEIPNRSGLSR
ncbi:hypothetical protein AVEN_15039-1 [Araneus ventricosus]|uniref:Uncharacterized protein n=1 Tax=Araneus ventricosus TaxID=182803 RepID=A0A4Y2NFN7_ARAVE|nr:hypothetical protein AVEN_15039-1 [Araneus ventricosus]